MAFWQLTVPASAETSDGLTNFLWEQGALGVVPPERVIASTKVSGTSLTAKGPGAFTCPVTCTF